MADAFVYVIGPDGGPYKVGYAQNPQTRLPELQTGHPRRLLLLHAVQHPSAWRIETLAHSSLQEHRMMGEWFDVPLERAIRTIEEIVAAEDDERRQRIEREFAEALAAHRAREDYSMTMMDLIGSGLTALDASTRNPKIIATGQRRIRRWQQQVSQRALCLWCP